MFSSNILQLLVLLPLVIIVSADVLFSWEGGPMYPQAANLYWNNSQLKTNSPKYVTMSQAVVFGGTSFNDFYTNSNSAITFKGSCSGTTCPKPKISINVQAMKQTQLTITQDDYVTQVEYKGYLSGSPSQQLQWKLVLYYAMYFKAEFMVTTFSLVSQTSQISFTFDDSITTTLHPTLNKTLNIAGCYVNCQYCSAYNVCTDCLSPFILTSDKLCSTATCASNCKVCNQADACLECRTGYYINIDSCFSCSEGCSSCTNSSVCTVCSSGYTLSSNSCVKTASDNTNNTNTSTTTTTTSSASSNRVHIIVGATVAGVALIAWLLAGYCFWKKKKRQMNQDIIIEGSAVPFQRTQGPRDDSKVYKASVFIKNPDLITTEDCSICLNANTSCLSTCGHFFHLLCIVDWFGKHRDCPVCRTKEIGLQIGCQACHKLFWVIRFCEPSCTAASHRVCLQARKGDLKQCFECRNKSTMPSSSNKFPLSSTD